MRPIAKALIFAGAAIALTGCQSTQDSLASAQYVCQSAGLRPGTHRYARCVNANYQQSQQQSNQAAAAVATGVAAGVVGGALVGAAVASPPYYGGPYYGSPYGFGPY